MMDESTGQEPFRLPIVQTPYFYIGTGFGSFRFLRTTPPRILVLLACCFTAASVRAAIPPTHAATVNMDPSHDRVDPSERRHLRAKVPDGSEEERGGLTPAQIEEIANKAAPNGFGLDELKALHGANLLENFKIDFHHVYYSYLWIQHFVTVSEEHPGNRVWMALGDVYFSKVLGKIPRTVQDLPQAHPDMEAMVKHFSEIFHIKDPMRGIYKVRWFLTYHGDIPIEGRSLAFMALGSELMEIIRVKCALFEVCTNEKVKPFRVQTIMDQFRQLNKHNYKSETDLLETAIKEAKEEAKKNRVSNQVLT
ncbi:hypothetical protein PsorP6_011481 [Peronosclerospora sorghi]|uniref:Uncharacterized protein n=1 Tax=Peronosclerospora sorghi TaxID=230839 RepID=A0ACC0WK38_9STRA|nr:hypothetical protein PsorP6_011481 [Peronosclerospora sorghi]